MIFIKEFRLLRFNIISFATINLHRKGRRLLAAAFG
jgi:hypothetical protein